MPSNVNFNSHYAPLQFPGRFLYMVTLPLHKVGQALQVNKSVNRKGIYDTSLSHFEEPRRKKKWFRPDPAETGTSI